MKPRLVHLTTTDMSLDWLLRPQLEAFRDAGYDVIAMSAPGPHVAALEASGIRHHGIDSLTRSMSPLADLRALRDLRRAFKELKPDIVHTHNPKPGVFGRLAARAAGVPAIVNTVHGLYALPGDWWAKRAIVYSLERVAAACSHHELLQNSEDLPVLRRLGIADERMTVLGNGIDLARFDPGRVEPDIRKRLRAEWGVTESTMVVGVVGRLVWEKGYRTVFAAANELAHDGHDIAIVVVGPDDPAKTAAVDETAKRAAEATGVRFLGSRTDMVEIYSAFDVYVLASHREGFPRSAMEASAMALPVVATDIRGCRQVVEDGVTGNLFGVEEDRQLTRLLANLAADPARRRALGAAAAAKAQSDFDDRRIIETTLRVYAQLLGQPAPLSGEKQDHAAVPDPAAVR